LVIAAIGLTLAVGPPSASAAAEATTVPDSCPKHPKVGTICGHTRILIVKYTVVKTCHVQRNYPLNPGTGRKAWTIEPGPKAVVGWRFNITANVAMISDPTAPDFPHWGIVTNSDCIGKTVGQDGHYLRYEKKNGKLGWVRYETPSIPAGQPMPTVILSGHSQNKKTHYWNTVDWTPKGPAIPAVKQKMAHNATLRDRPNEFVIANVMKGWEVRPTSEKRGTYTRVYVPSLKRWGWLQI
jgi:hypothetical protein